MKTPNDGGPAFPHRVREFDSGYSKTTSFDGMTLRDWFAGMALQGMMASESNGNGILPQYEPSQTWPERTAARAYHFSDAMIAERSKNQ